MGLRFISFLILFFHKGVRRELNESYAIHDFFFIRVEYRQGISIINSIFKYY
jgi:hypothetical protein